MGLGCEIGEVQTPIRFSDDYFVYTNMLEHFAISEQQVQRLELWREDPDW